MPPPGKGPQPLLNERLNDATPTASADVGEPLSLQEESVWRPVTEALGEISHRMSRLSQSFSGTKGLGAPVISGSGTGPGAGSGKLEATEEALHPKAGDGEVGGNTG